MGRKLLGRSTYLINDEQRTLLEGKRTWYSSMILYVKASRRFLACPLQHCYIGIDRLASIKKNTIHNITIQTMKGIYDFVFFGIRPVELHKMISKEPNRRKAHVVLIRTLR